MDLKGLKKRVAQSLSKKTGFKLELILILLRENNMFVLLRDCGDISFSFLFFLVTNLFRHCSHTEMHRF